MKAEVEYRYCIYTSIDTHMISPPLTRLYCTLHPFKPHPSVNCRLTVPINPTPNPTQPNPTLKTTLPHLTPPHLPPSHNLTQNSPNSPFVPSSTCTSNLTPYFRLYSTFTRSRCLGSQWKRTRREMRSSVRSLEVSARAWWRRRASRTGRLRTPLRMWARVSPWRNGDVSLWGRGEGVCRVTLERGGE